MARHVAQFSMRCQFIKLHYVCLFFPIQWPIPTLLLSATGLREEIDLKELFLSWNIPP
jgi:hypothetical protein